MFIMFLFNAYLASGWNIISGFAGQLSLGHAAFVGIGAYTSTILFVQWGISPWIGMIFGGVIAAIFGWLIGYPVFKLRGPYYALATIAYGEIIRIFIQNTKAVGPIELKGAEGILIPFKGSSPALFQFETKAAYYYVALAMFLLVLLLSYKIKNSKMGYYLSAIGNDQDAAESLGVNTSKMKLTASAISAFVMALGGTFYAQFLLYINPQGVLSGDFSTEIAVIGIIGGEGTVFGPVLGSLILTPLSELTRIYLGGRFAGVHLLAYGLILMAVVTHIPHGVIGTFSKLYHRILLKLGDPVVSAKTGAGKTL
ncbi:branched-chain amino acid ABC transporter permease [Paradesulfitobacterium ferrireducens]|uniref:branched-chain amino acid ABC transporter permease n=1 Tax=Paradesulfitobacterium ferrireducens TaxID=2816476 RepID=UPI001A8FB6AB|nr:branched-chain amino acid ABC transporter permease [Paradesulfitobacterium ferrireducens]